MFVLLLFLTNVSLAIYCRIRLDQMGAQQPTNGDQSFLYLSCFLNIYRVIFSNYSLMLNLFSLNQLAFVFPLKTFRFEKKFKNIF